MRDFVDNIIFFEIIQEDVEQSDTVSKQKA
jgi:hypothetical protein